VAISDYSNTHAKMCDRISIAGAEGMGQPTLDVMDVRLLAPARSIMLQSPDRALNC
jgi:hypothetical protein